jgi:hypothetical protein
VTAAEFKTLLEFACCGQRASVLECGGPLPLSARQNQNEKRFDLGKSNQT